MAGRTYLLLDDARIFGGGQRVALRLAEYVAAERADLSLRLVCPPGSELATAAAASSVECLPASFPDPTPLRAPRLVAAARGLRRLLRPLDRKDVVIANSARAQALTLLAARGLADPPAIVNYMHEQESAGRISVRFVHRRFGRVLAVGSNGHRAYARRMPGVPIEQVNNFLLAGEYSRLEAGRHELHAPPALGTIARLIPEKGVLELVEELAAGPDAWRSLEIAGPFQDPAYADLVRSRVAALGLAERVTLLGERPVAQLLGAIDALVVPSVKGEVQPTVVLEALAAGVPVVVREGIYEAAYDGLPVATYATPDELRSRLSAPHPRPAPISELLRRFGPEQALEGIERAARGTPAAPAFLSSRP